MAGLIFSSGCGRRERRNCVKNALKIYCRNKGENGEFEKNLLRAGGRGFGGEERRMGERWICEKIKGYLLEAMKNEKVLGEREYRKRALSCLSCIFPLRVQSMENIDAVISNAPVGWFARRRLEKWPAREFLQVLPENDAPLVNKDLWAKPPQKTQG
ncbi:hypothetical protein COU37_00845 [Candidatus Micrarchaeota archaeon CG10_big_fil_rev_8_21_14_0_10_45_29]|nr:MAG: hypothetical protein COU37_00845 [Candidatus Micrarchaeota archaeon CG10_big_fil_rev_8_21_14_0_10_45_29]